MKLKAKIAYSVLFLSAALGAVPMAQAADFTLSKRGNFTGSYLSSQYARSTGDIEGATRHLKRVHQKRPNDPVIINQLLGALLMMGDIDEALTLAKDSSHADSADPLSLLLLALRDIKKRDFAAASTTLDRADDDMSKQIWTPLLRGWVDAELGRLDAPMTEQDISPEFSRASPLINYHMALINARAGHIEAAIANFKNAIEDPQTASPRLMEALISFNNEHQSPELAPFAESYLQTVSGRARTPFTVANAQDGVAEALYTIGGVMLAAEAVNDALLYLQLALYVKPDMAEAAISLGDSYNELRQHARANEAYGKVSAKSPLYAKAQLGIALNYDRAGKTSDALALMNKMIKNDIARTDVMIARADLLRIHKRYPEAVDGYTQALTTLPEISGEYWPVYFARGSSLERQGKWEEAKADLKRALELKPDQPDVLNYLGYGLLEHNENLNEARAMIEKAVKERPNDAQIVDSMGWSLYLQGDYERAVDYIEKAVELLPGDAIVNDHLGDAYWRLGRKTEARYQWERTLGFEPTDDMAENLRKKLKDGLPPSDEMVNNEQSASVATP